MATVIINYGAGNIRSVFNAFDLIGGDAIVTNDHKDIESAERLVLPGVGSYSKCAEMLKHQNLIDIIEQRVVVDQVPFLGICVGMQLTSTYGCEGGRTDGLGWIPGKVEKIAVPEQGILPHVGWNTVEFKKPHPVWNGLKDTDFYFTHSYSFCPDDSAAILGTTRYYGDIVAAVHKNNIIATQFHPEKSGETGLSFLENFLEL